MKYQGVGRSPEFKSFEKPWLQLFSHTPPLPRLTCYLLPGGTGPHCLSCLVPFPTISQEEPHLPPPPSVPHRCNHRAGERLGCRAGSPSAAVRRSRAGARALSRDLCCAAAVRAAPTCVIALLLAVGAPQARGGCPGWDEYFLSPQIQNRQITVHCSILTCAANQACSRLIFLMLLLPIH